MTTGVEIVTVDHNRSEFGGHFMGQGRLPGGASPVEGNEERSRPFKSSLIAASRIVAASIALLIEPLGSLSYPVSMAVDLAFRIGRGVQVWGHGLGFRWIALFLFLAFLALIAVGVALLWRYGTTSGTATRPDDALTTVRMRYARGEMTRDEFLQAHEDLGGAPTQLPPPPPPSA